MTSGSFQPFGYVYVVTNTSNGKVYVGQTAKEESMTKQETRAFKATELRVGTDTEGKRTLAGYTAVFNSDSEDFGGWIERIAPTAFDRTLSEGADVRCLVEHDPARIVGRTKSGTLKLYTDTVGLRFECTLPDTSVARDLVASIERGDLDACSFGFVAQKQEWLEDSKTGLAIRTLLDVDLFDASVVAYPAYPATSVNVRSAIASMPVEIRSRFEKRDAADGDGNDNGCNCECPECVDNDCMDCSDPDCTDPNCLANQRKHSKSKRALTDQCTCACAQCMSQRCGICSASPKCEGATREEDDSNRSALTWHDHAMLRLRIAEAE